MTYTIQEYKDLQMSAAEREATEFQRTGKIGAQLEEMICNMVDSESLVNVLAMILTHAPKGDIYQALETAAYSDWWCERQIERIEEFNHQNNVAFKRGA